MSAYFLGAQMLRLSGINVNRYWEMVLYAAQHFRGLTENHYFDIFGNTYDIHRMWCRYEEEYRHAWGLKHINAFAGINHVKWFGNDEFYESLLKY